MSIRAMTWAWSLDELDTAQTMVLLVLADAANEEDGLACWPSQQFVARKARMSVRSVKRHIATLRAVGLIDVEVQSSVHGRRSNLYQLHVGAKPDFSAVNRKRANLAPGDACSGESGGISAKGQFGPLGGEGTDEALKGPTVTPSKGTLVAPSNIGTVIKNPNLTEPNLHDLVKRSDDEDCGVVGSGRAESVDRSSGSSGLSVADSGLLAQCLPPGMQALDPSGAARVVGLLRERLDAGWRPREIRSLMDQPVPGDVGRLSALVAYRLEHNVAPLMAPARLQRVALDAEASRRRRAVEALERDAGADVDPVWSRVWDEVTAECVGVSRVVQVREAQKRYDRLVGDQA